MKEPGNATNRKLIRPSLSEVKEQMNRKKRQPHNHQRKRQSPPDQTNAETFYFVKQMQNHTPLVDRPRGSYHMADAPSGVRVFPVEGLGSFGVGVDVTA